MLKRLARRLSETLIHPYFARIVLGAGIAGFVWGGFLVPLAAPLWLRMTIGVRVGVYLASSLLVARIVVLLGARRWIEEPTRSLDFAVTPYFLWRGPSAWIVPIVVFAGLTLLRESDAGGWGFDFHLASESRREQWSSTHHYGFTTSGVDRQWLRDLPLSCDTSSQRRDSWLGRGFVDAVRCPRDAHAAGVRATFSLQAPDAFCHFPLFADDSVRFTSHVGVSASWSGPGGRGSGGGSVDVSGTIAVRSIGFSSCRRINASIGAQIARIVVGRVNDFLRTN